MLARLFFRLLGAGWKRVVWTVSIYGIHVGQFRCDGCGEVERPGGIAYEHGPHAGCPGADGHWRLVTHNPHGGDNGA